jgi:hypothetical protein
MNFKIIRNYSVWNFSYIYKNRHMQQFIVNILQILQYKLLHVTVFIYIADLCKCNRMLRYSMEF